MWCEILLDPLQTAWLCLSGDHSTGISDTSYYTRQLAARGGREGGPSLGRVNKLCTIIRSLTRAQTRHSLEICCDQTELRKYFDHFADHERDVVADSWELWMVDVNGLSLWRLQGGEPWLQCYNTDNTVTSQFPSLTLLFTLSTLKQPTRTTTNK